MRNLTIVFFDAGGGHRNAAEALKTALEQQPRPWNIQLMNLQEQLDSIDVIRRATGIRIQDGYNLILRKGWTRPTKQLLVLLRGLVRLYHGQVVAMLEKYWREHPADVVLSVIPLFNRALAESLRSTAPQTAFATLITDLADCPPHFWIEKESEFLICGTGRAVEQAFAVGHSRDHVFHTSGMILKEKFYDKPQLDRRAERERLGLHPDLPTGIVMFGGHGAPVMADIAERIDEGPAEVQQILICGHNQKLYSELATRHTRHPMRVEGFTTNVAHYMAISDFFIGKPGPGSISEALQFDLPVILECNARTMPQERYNTDWVLENRVGIVLKNFSEIALGVEQLLQPATFAELSANARSYTNRAIFEVPAILEEVLERHVPISVPIFSGVSMGQGAAWAGSGGIVR